MRDFASRRLQRMDAYVPGEQPQNRQFIKLNTNESPFPPSPLVAEAIRSFDADSLRLYPPPGADDLVAAIAAYHGVRPAQVFAGNGSDEVLALSFLAFCDEAVYFPDITYGFYSVYADLFGIRGVQIPLADDYAINVDDYASFTGCVFIANPNAPTGLALSAAHIEDILRANPDHVVMIDEAYADFARENALALLDRYENLLIVRTFSKSRALAGLRIGYAVGREPLIQALYKAKDSFNSYNLDRMAIAAGCAAMRDDAYFKKSCAAVVATREQTKSALRELGFSVLDSQTNFVFARHERISGHNLCVRLREKSILVRHFDRPRIRDFVRITIGTPEEMRALRAALGEILSE